MTRTTAARLAGFTLLFYIVVGISTMAGAFHGASREFAIVAQNVSAVVLGITFYVITRAQGPRQAALGMIFRSAEGSLPAILAAMGIALSRPSLVAATLFAMGSAVFCVLLLRGRMMPRGLAWLGVAASAILVVGLPLQLGGLVRGTLTQVMWLPMLAFEVPAGVWLMVKGVPPATPIATLRAASRTPRGGSAGGS